MDEIITGTGTPPPEGIITVTEKKVRKNHHATPAMKSTIKREFASVVLLEVVVERLKALNKGFRLGGILEIPAATSTRQNSGPLRLLAAIDAVKEPEEVGGVLKRREKTPAVLHRRVSIDAPRLLRRDSRRELPEAEHSDEISDEDIFLSKSVTPNDVQQLHEIGLRAMQDFLLNKVPKIFMVDVIPYHARTPQGRFLVRAMSAADALSHLRTENDVRLRTKKKTIFPEDATLHLVVPAFTSNIMEV